MNSPERAAAKERVLDRLLVRIDQSNPEMAVKITLDEARDRGELPEIIRGLEGLQREQLGDYALRQRIRSIRAAL